MLSVSISVILALTTWPIDKTSSALAICFWQIWEIWTRPSTPSSNSTNAPKSTRRTTLPSTISERWYLSLAKTQGFCCASFKEREILFFS